MVDSMQDKDNAMSAYLCMKCYERTSGLPRATRS